MFNGPRVINEDNNKFNGSEDFTQTILCWIFDLHKWNIAYESRKNISKISLLNNQLTKRAFLYLSRVLKSQKSSKIQIKGVQCCVIKAGNDKRLQDLYYNTLERTRRFKRKILHTDNRSETGSEYYSMG